MKTIALTRGKVAIVDDADYESLNQFKWCAHFGKRSNNRWSAHREINGRMVSMQEAILGKRTGMEIDHRDRDALNNQRSNLRFCSRAQNSMNRGKRRGTQWPVKGVFRNNMGRFTARIIMDGKRRSVGTFSSLEEASAAYDAAARNFYGEFAAPNNN